MLNADDLAWWREQLGAHWDLNGTFKQLGGEFDLNFRAGEDAILKVMRVGCDPDLVGMQIAAIDRLTAPEAVRQSSHAPRYIRSRSGSAVPRVRDRDGNERIAWALECLPGKPYANIRPHTRELVQQIGASLASIDQQFETFDHEALDRDCKWNLCRPLWVREHLELIANESRRAQLAEILDRFQSDCEEQLNSLPMQALHNDLNDYNILCTTGSDGAQVLTGIIDFGDMLRGPVICDLAIAAAYIVLDHPRPIQAVAELVAGYCSVRRLTALEIDLIWPLVLTRLAVSALNAADMQRENPDDPYVMISQEPIDRFLLRLPRLNEIYIRGRLRRAAGYEAVPHGSHVTRWLSDNTARIASVFKEDLSDACVLDLSVAGREAPQNPITLDCDELTSQVDAIATDGRAVLGRYGEPRLIYTEPGFRGGDHPATDRRTVHMALDVFLPAGTPLHAPLDGCVHSVDVCPEHLGYGGVLVLRHETDDGLSFYTLFGHLAHDVTSRHKVGDNVKAGQVVGLLGSEDENGGWGPHVHLQLNLFAQDGPDVPGVADPDEWDIWQDLCPNPSVLLGLPERYAIASEVDHVALIQQRSAQTSGNLKVSYAQPVTVLRGWKSFLFDDRGRPYLDAYNNVPHVGHAHPRITEVVSRQMRMVNTNTRYLQPVHEAYAEALCARMPDPLSVCFLLSSGSEANEVALRLARAHTSAKDTIVMAHGYHGHTCTTIDLSDYKFSGPGGDGQPDWVHVVPNPDVYRGMWGADDPDAGRKYAGSIRDVVDELMKAERRLGAFIAESFPSVGGQIVPPPGYLKSVYDHVRSAGGVCIADEVQTGLGRLGQFEWGFSHQDVVPDIVVLGKPIGNGYPLAAVVTTRAIADSFANGMEYFSTFGGSTVSCVVGHEVLRILDDEELANNAEKVGRHLSEGLRACQRRTPAIGDVRGLGLFIGVEMIEPDGQHSRRKAGYVVERLRQQRILIGSDGPEDNVLKIRPPLCFSMDDADYFLNAIDDVFKEDVIQNS